VRVNRNHFGRQTESFQANLDLPFLRDTAGKSADQPYRCVFIRAPVVEKVLPHSQGVQSEEAERDETVVAPSKTPVDELAKQALRAGVEVMATLPVQDREDIIAVRQGNVFGCSFHPELTGDARIHAWWLEEVLEAAQQRQQYELADRTR
jgi:5'-phosphate synthase pdxT subunit